MVTSGVNNSLSQSELLQHKATQVVNRQTGIGSGNLGWHLFGLSDEGYSVSYFQ